MKISDFLHSKAVTADLKATSKKEVIGRELDCSPDGALKHILSNLCERRILANRPAGYTILAPSGKLKEIRPALEGMPEEG